LTFEANWAITSTFESWHCRNGKTGPFSRVVIAVGGMLIVCPELTTSSIACGILVAAIAIIFGIGRRRDVAEA